MAAGSNNYWTALAQRWDTAISAVGGALPAHGTRIRKPWLPFVLQSQVPIAITGERGAGKTALYAMLTGNRAADRHQTSEIPEYQRLAIHSPSGRLRSTFVVVPGQDSDKHRPTLDRLFAGSGPRGVIHVVSAGYDWVWNSFGREILEDQLRREAAERADEITLLTKQDGDATGVARLTELRRLAGHDIDWHLREQLRRSELDRFRELCENYLQPAWRRTQRPVWLIVAVTKCDLWWDHRDQVRSYYLPGAGSHDSDFAAELHDLVHVLDQDRLRRLAVMPVASYPDTYRFSRTVRERRPALGMAETGGMVDRFRNVLGEFCDLRT